MVAFNELTTSDHHELFIDVFKSAQLKHEIICILSTFERKLQ